MDVQGIAGLNSEPGRKALARQLRRRVPCRFHSDRTLMAALALLGLSGVAQADCIEDAAAFQHVNVNLMRAIAQVESGTKSNAINPNSNGTFDIGLMQINSSWLPRLAREGITQQSLFDPCTNAYVGAWILSENIRQLGPTWNAVGAYNAASPDKRIIYARKVYDMAHALSGSSDSTMPILPPSFTPPQSYDPFAALNVSSAQVSRARGNANAAIPAIPAVPPPASGTDITQASEAAYNFNWTVTGADDAKPIQVFDDGKKVFVQFTDMKHVPAIFAETKTGRVLLRWDLQYPYAVISRPAQVLVFQMGALEARAQKVGATGDSGAAGKATGANKAGENNAAQAGSASASNQSASSVDALWYVTTTSPSHPARSYATAQPTAAPPAANAATIKKATPQQAASAPAATVRAPGKSKDASATADALWYVVK
jgi:hypothetical protein